MPNFFLQSLAWTLSVVLLTSCVSRPLKQEEAPAAEPAAEKIDLEGLKKDLGLSRSKEDLGFVEKRFDSCSVGFGYSRAHDCRSLFLVTIQFRLQCRTKDDANLVSKQDIYPVTSREVKWSLATHTGITATDSEGYGEILVASPISLKRARLKITVSGRFLIINAAEITRIVTPPPWCQSFTSDIR